MLPSCTGGGGVGGRGVDGAVVERLELIQTILNVQKFILQGLLQYIRKPKVLNKVQLINCWLGSLSFAR